MDRCHKGRKVDGPTAWDGYVGQVTAKAASKARDEKKVVEITFDEMPEFSLKNKKSARENFGRQLRKRNLIYFYLEESTNS